MLALVVVASLISLSLGALRARSPQARFGWLAALVAFASLALSSRMGVRGTLVAAPLLVWLLLRWHQSGAGRRPSVLERQAAMTHEQALRVLGLTAGATPEAISVAHRSLIKKLHPDHGGSNYLAQQVNEAKRVLESGQD